jgi:hypothetical protein
VQAQVEHQLGTLCVGVLTWTPAAKTPSNVYRREKGGSRTQAGDCQLKTTQIGNRCTGGGKLLPLEEILAGEHWRPEPVVKFGLDTAGNSDWLPPQLRMSTRGRLPLFGFFLHG